MTICDVYCAMKVSRSKETALAGLPLATSDEALKYGMIDEILSKDK